MRSLALGSPAGLFTNPWSVVTQAKNWTAKPIKLIQELRDVACYNFWSLQLIIFSITFWSGDKIEEKIVKHTINMHFHVTHRLKWRQDWRQNSQSVIQQIWSSRDEDVSLLRATLILAKRQFPSRDENRRCIPQEFCSSILSASYNNIKIADLNVNISYKVLYLILSACCKFPI